MKVSVTLEVLVLAAVLVWPCAWNIDINGKWAFGYFVRRMLSWETGVKWWLSASSPPYRAEMLWNTNAFRPSRLVNPHFPLSAERFSSQTPPFPMLWGFLCHASHLHKYSMALSLRQSFQTYWRLSVLDSIIGLKLIVLYLWNWPSYFWNLFIFTWWWYCFLFF